MTKPYDAEGFVRQVNPNLPDGKPKEVAELFAQIAYELQLISNNNTSQQYEAGMQKLLEAKDCFVRDVL